MDGPQAESLTSLKWRKCAEAPFKMYDSQAVCLKGEAYIGGGGTPNYGTDSTILVYDSKMNSWKTIKSPTYQSALATYQGKLVLVGGTQAALTDLRMDDSRHGTNKLWSLQDDDRWTDELPPMPTPRWGASAVDTGSRLIVAGGYGGLGLYSALNVVEVFDGRQWMGAESLPITCNNMKSTLHNGEWYLMGGQWQGKSVYCTAVDSLIATTGSSRGKGGSVWKILPEVPLSFSSIAMLQYGNQLLAIGGMGHSKESAIYGYIADKKSWKHVGDLPISIYSTCSVVLPSWELLVVGGMSPVGLSSSVFKAKLRALNLQQFCVMAIVRNNINYSKLPLHLQKMVRQYF